MEPIDKKDKDDKTEKDKQELHNTKKQQEAEKNSEEPQGDGVIPEGMDFKKFLGCGG